MASQRWKTSEREFATKLQKAAGKVKDPRIAPLVTVTGRVGHLTDLGFDILVGEGETAFCGEAKRRKSFLAADAVRALLQIARIAVEWSRTPVLGFRLADDLPAFIETRLGKRRLERNWLILPLPFAEKSIAALRYVEENNLMGDFIDWQDNQVEATEDAEESLA